MTNVRFKGFPPDLFRFLAALSENNNKQWFDEHASEYRATVLDPVKTFVADIGPILRMLNEEIETEPRVGRTISRINNDLRFHKNRQPYRPFIYALFPRRGKKWSEQSLLYVGLYRHGVSVGFYPGGYKEPRTGRVQQSIKKNLRLFQRYLDERAIAENYWELAGGEEAAVTKWPLPKTARRWMNLDSFNVGEYFPATEPVLLRRAFLNVAQEIILDLYPLWLFATSDNIKNDFELYQENAPSLARPLTRSAGGRR
ncbi:MAG TPA: DUF2461 family protein [Blastocatellia bacterium]|nr:DUF2461 family protein [Blastocatellia bacterium]